MTVAVVSILFHLFLSYTLMFWWKIWTIFQKISWNFYFSSGILDKIRRYHEKNGWNPEKLRYFRLNREFVPRNPQKIHFAAIRFAWSCLQIKRQMKPKQKKLKIRWNSSIRMHFNVISMQLYCAIGVNVNVCVWLDSMNGWFS